MQGLMTGNLIDGDEYVLLVQQHARSLRKHMVMGAMLYAVRIWGLMPLCEQAQRFRGLRQFAYQKAKDSCSITHLLHGGTRSPVTGNSHVQFVRRLETCMRGRGRGESA